MYVIFSHLEKSLSCLSTQIQWAHCIPPPGSTSQWNMSASLSVVTSYIHINVIQRGVSISETIVANHK